MKKTLLTTLTLVLMTVVTACGEKETVNVYTPQTIDQVESSEATEDVNDNATTEESSADNAENDTEDTITESEDIQENVDNTEESSVDDEENNSDKTDMQEISEPEATPVPASIGKEFTGKLDFTTEWIVEKFTDLSNYENNETSQEVIACLQDYLNNYSTEEMINLWSEYSDLEKSQRYALIELTRYVQSFGSYNKSAMDSALKGNDTYIQDLKTIDSDLK